MLKFEVVVKVRGKFVTIILKEHSVKRDEEKLEK